MWKLSYATKDGLLPTTREICGLEAAIRQGVTRDKTLGQGNGLFGSYQVCSHSNGTFSLESGWGRLEFGGQRRRATTATVPFDGTLVAAQINCSDPRLLAEALQFGGRPHVPLDHVELFYEQHDRDEVLVAMTKETRSFGSRMAGTPVRNRLMNFTPVQISVIPACRVRNGAGKLGCEARAQFCASTWSQ